MLMVVEAVPAEKVIIQQVVVQVVTQQQVLVEVALEDGGGDHACGAGGYSGGSGEQDTENSGYNGLGGQIYNVESCGGGGYFTNGVGKSYNDKGIGRLGGQGGKWLRHDQDSYTDLGYYVQAKGGDGGIAGKGGIIRYSSNAIIYAYNGNMITNSDYTTEYYSYTKDGNITNTKLSIMTKLNGEQFVPLTIFAQLGIIRETYTTNSTQAELDKITVGNTKYTPISTVSDAMSILATNETTTPVTGYSNGYMLNQGIGSGAGYLESTNGTYTVDASMN